MEEAVTVTTNLRIANPHCMPVHKRRLPHITRPHKRMGNAALELIRTATKVIATKKRERSYLSTEGKEVKG